MAAMAFGKFVFSVSKLYLMAVLAEVSIYCSPEKLNKIDFTVVLGQDGAQMTPTGQR